MRMRGAVGGWKTLSRLALVGVIGSGAAACSTDASRLSEPFSNPFSSLGEPSATGSLGQGEDAVETAAPAIRTSRIQSQSLAAPRPVMSPRPAQTAALAPPPVGAVGGMNPSGLNPDAGRAPKAQAMTPRVVPAAPAKAAEKKAEAKKAPEPSKPVKVDHKKAEAAKKAEAEAKLARADASKNAAKKVAEAKAAEAAAKASSAKETKVSAKETKVTAKETKVAVKEIPAAKPAPAPEPAAAPAPVAASNDSFRWPAKGRVINGYGSSGNEGINIAVPEGTPVKAAEEGTVAYAGSDVKGYGKLVLVRHSNGFVSAYAHNGELDVKPGEKVKRGQVIAKSGATGNVTSPQLHFEIRKGATPVDPIPHLASN